MKRSEFEQSLGRSALPVGLSRAQAALWHAKRGDWDAAHGCAQNEPGRDGAWVHAYLHRWEGDAGNAGYWYRQAGQPFCRLTLEEEWEQLVAALFTDQ